jgi:hypothetical protein
VEQGPSLVGKRKLDLKKKKGHDRGQRLGFDMMLPMGL